VYITRLAIWTLIADSETADVKNNIAWCDLTNVISSNVKQQLSNPWIISKQW